MTSSGPVSRSKMANISPEVLIPLVEQRSVIWDKTLDIHKDKRLKSAAWREICCVFDPNYDNLGDKERKEFATNITTKWIHIRDAFMRTLRKKKEVKRAGAGKTPRPYVYKNHLSFLQKINEPPMKIDTVKLEPYHELDSSDSCSDTDLESSPAEKKIKIKVEAIDEEPIQIPDSKFNQFDKLDTQEHPHVSFIKGVLPSLASFDDDEHLELQMGILALIQKIKKKHRESNS